MRSMDSRCYFVELSNLVELALDTRGPLTDAALHFVSRVVLLHS
jgi:hypothetical protein